MAVKTGKGSQVNAGDALLEFDVSSIEEQAKKLEDEIRILQLKIELSGSEGGNDVITAQRNLEDARQAYHRLSEKYARQNTRLQEDYSKLEEKLAAAETRDEKAVAATRQDLIDKAEAVVKEAKENLEDIKDAAEELSMTPGESEMMPQTIWMPQGRRIRSCWRLIIRRNVMLTMRIRR